MPLSTTKGKQPKPRRIMLYGVHGIGKSTFAHESPGSVFLPTEDGISDLDVEAFPLAESFGDFMGYLAELCQEEHDRKTIVIDTLDWLERLIWQAVVDEQGKSEITSIEDIGYAKGYVFALKQWRQVLTHLDWLRNNKGMSCILLAHARVQKCSPPDNDSFDRYTPKLHKHASEIVQEWCDEVLFANYQVYTSTQGEGFDKHTRGVDGGVRFIHTTEKPSHLAKNRCQLPETLPLSWQKFADAVSF